MYNSAKMGKWNDSWWLLIAFNILEINIINNHDDITVEGANQTAGPDSGEVLAKPVQDS